MINRLNGTEGRPGHQSITTMQLAEMLGVSRTTIHRMKTAGELPPTIPTKRRIVRWLLKDIELWLDLDCPKASDFLVYKRDLQRYTRRRKPR